MIGFKTLGITSLISAGFAAYVAWAATDAYWQVSESDLKAKHVIALQEKQDLLDQRDQAAREAKAASDAAIEAATARATAAIRERDRIYQLIKEDIANAPASDDDPIGPLMRRTLGSLRQQGHPGDRVE